MTGPWMINEEEFHKLEQEKGIYWTSGGEEQPYGKIYLHESLGQIPCDFLGIEFGTNQRASLEVQALFDRRAFDFPKPVSLIRTFVEIGANKSSIILDFFSGSATTAHAVIQLNAEDSGNRKFIMVQLPEECKPDSEAKKAGYTNICEIGKERIRRAGKKIKENAPLTTAELDVGFRVLKLDTTNMKDVYHPATEYKQENLDALTSNIKDDREPLDLLFGCLIDWGLPLSLPYKKEKFSGSTVHTVNNGDLIACFDNKISEKTIREIARRNPIRAVFRDSSFKSSADKINVAEIFKVVSPKTSVRVV